MGMHSDAKTNILGLDAIEVQLRRRVFWQLYASDKRVLSLLNSGVLI